KEALESALVANPDDLGTHMAYADYLMEHGDPRGEFIRVQLALEDPAKSAAERKKLQQQEKTLLKKHERDWLGALAPWALSEVVDEQHDWNSPKGQYAFARGWLDSLEIQNYTVAFTRALADVPQTALLRRLALIDNVWEEEGEYERTPDMP